VDKVSREQRDGPLNESLAGALVCSPAVNVDGLQPVAARRRASSIHSFTAICKAHYAENVESEALEAIAKWSV